MKKILFVAAIAALSFTSCNKDDDNSVTCTVKITRLADAAQTYTTDQSSANCVTYKEALEDAKGCGSTQDDETYQALIDGLNCE